MNKELINEAVQLLEKVTGKKVKLIKESASAMEIANDIFGSISTPRNWEYKAKELIKNYRLNPEQENQVMQALAGEHFFGSENIVLENDGDAPNMNKDISNQKGFKVKTDGINSKEINVDVLDRITFKNRAPLYKNVNYWWCNRNGYLDILGYYKEENEYFTDHDLPKEEILETNFNLAENEALKALDKAAQHYNLKADWY